jgi:hypothetical protein
MTITNDTSPSPAILSQMVIPSDAAGNPLAVRAVVAATIGNLLEWYDFAVYGYFAAILGKLFFPAVNTTTSLLLTFATFGVGFLMRQSGRWSLGSTEIVAAERTRSC